MEVEEQLISEQVKCREIIKARTEQLDEQIRKLKSQLSEKTKSQELS